MDPRLDAREDLKVSKSILMDDVDGTSVLFLRVSDTEIARLVDLV
jgi:hypothetical protein